LPEFPLLALGFTPIRTRNFRLVPGDIQSNIVEKSPNPVSSSDESASSGPGHSPQHATDPELGDVPHIRTLVKIDGSIRVRTVAPKLGQHNAEIFGRKGLSEQDIETQQAQRVV